MSASSVQAWVAIVGGILTAVVGLLQYFRYRSKRDRMASVGTAFFSTVGSLRSDDDIERMAAAVLLRRFFERETEQGGRRRPYKRETVEVIAGILRSLKADEEKDKNKDEDRDKDIFQKVLADGLRYARDLASADLQRCNLRGAYLGRKPGDKWRLNITHADLFGADCTAASFREVIANEAVFYEAILEGTVFADAELRKADFRNARLKGAKFGGAKIGGARFAGAVDVPQEVAKLLDPKFVGKFGAEVPSDGDSS
jgi:Pentapeptide repeats (8 copies)